MDASQTQDAAAVTWVPVTAAVHLFPGPPPHPLTVRRWITEGVDGIQLGAVQRGARWFLTKASIDKFLADRTRKAGGVVEETSTVESVTARADRVRAGLVEDGFRRQPKGKRHANN